MSTQLWVAPVSSRKLPLSSPNVRLANGLLKTEMSMGIRLPAHGDVSAIVGAIVATDRVSKNKAVIIGHTNQSWSTASEIHRRRTTSHVKGSLHELDQTERTIGSSRLSPWQS